MIYCTAYTDGKTVNISLQNASLLFDKDYNIGINRKVILRVFYIVIHSYIDNHAATKEDE